MTTATPQSDSLSRQPDRTSPGMARTPDNLTIIGIGASAGGLTPLRTFFASLPPDTGMTFVVVHLLPDHESILADLLRGYTPMPVTQVQARVAMEPNHVYVIPPAKRLLVTARHARARPVCAAGCRLYRARRREEQYRTLFESIDEGFCRIEVLFDEHDRPVDYRFLEVNPAFMRQSGLLLL